MPEISYIPGMLRITIKTKKERHEVDLPQSWTELTWAQGVAITTAKDVKHPHIFHLSILTGLPQKFWYEFTDLKQFQDLVQATDWVRSTNQVEEMNSAAFHKIEWEGKTYELPLDVGQLPVGIFEDARALVQAIYAWLKDAQENPDQANWEEYLTDTATLFKMYFQYVRDGEYRASQLKNINIDALPYYKVIRWRDFFLKSIIESLSGTERTSKKSQPMLMRWWRAIKTSVKNLALRLQFIISPGATLRKKIGFTKRPSTGSTEKSSLSTTSKRPTAATTSD